MEQHIMDSYESTENALIDSFKAAAVKVTTLYKDSLVQNRKAYGAGYQQALQDLYEFISTTQPENGFISVADVLEFARNKNNQLVNEIGINNQNGSSNSSSSSSSSNSSNKTNPTVVPSTNTSTDTSTLTANSENVTPNITPNHHHHHHHYHHPVAAAAAAAADISLQKQPVANNPFQTDPNTQFTFTYDNQSVNRTNGGGMEWDQPEVVDGLSKRKMVPYNGSEIPFVQRPATEGWEQPMFKRSRSKRDEQLQNVNFSYNINNNNNNDFNHLKYNTN